tara:strand:- start:12147 stop:12671 length:525 start_codon:yes stop_codon:yes gene_type:complete
MKTVRIVLSSIGFVTTIAMALIAANVVLHATNHGRNGEALLELTKLEIATDSYEVRYGERFPLGGRDRIQSHFQKIAPWMRNPVDLLESEGRSVDTLDQSEMLVLFLGEDMKRVFDDMKPEFSFPNDQLIDRDNDGWKEYISPDGSLYTMDGGCVVLRNMATGELTKLPGQSNE